MTEATIATSQAVLTNESLPDTNADRRSLRSRRMLREACAELIAERGLDGFSVGELTERADLNRGTFYAHYKDLPDMLASLEAEIIDSLASLRPKLQAVPLGELLAFPRKGQPPAVTVELFDILRQHGALLRVLLSPTGDAGFQARLRDRLCTDLIRSVLHDKYTRQPNALTNYYIAYYAAALLGLIWRWLDGGMAEDSQQMARIMLSIMFLKPGDPIELKGGAKK